MRRSSARRRAYARAWRRESSPKIRQPPKRCTATMVRHRWWDASERMRGDKACRREAATYWRAIGCDYSACVTVPAVFSHATNEIHGAAPAIGTHADWLSTAMPSMRRRRLRVMRSCSILPRGHTNFVEMMSASSNRVLRTTCRADTALGHRCSDRNNSPVSRRMRVAKQRRVYGKIFFPAGRNFWQESSRRPTMTADRLLQG